ncbi:MAG: hypothetical protein KBT01_02665 [Clostridiales bacterium]|nr:hypothetical protein [Candidatus Blautia equi]
MASKASKTVKATLLTDAKRVLVYTYGKDGKITVNKRLLGEEDLDMVEEILNGSIEITNSSDCKNTIDLFGIKVDEDALSALGSIFD